MAHEYEPRPQQPDDENTTERRDSNPSLEREQPLDPPSIYVASLADYNDGRLHGVWIDATQDVDDIRAAIEAMLRRSPELRARDETFGDWAIHDYDGFGMARLGELVDLELVHAVALGIAKHGEAFAAWIDDDDVGGPELYDQLDALFELAYLGEYASLAAYGQEIWDDMGWQEKLEAALPPEALTSLKLDPVHLAQMMWNDGDISIVHSTGGRVWIFRQS